MDIGMGMDVDRVGMYIPIPDHVPNLKIGYYSYPYSVNARIFCQNWDEFRQYLRRRVHLLFLLIVELLLVMVVLVDIVTVVNFSIFN